MVAKAFAVQQSQVGQLTGAETPHQVREHLAIVGTTYTSIRTVGG